eukprot:CAMPEP_0116872290 /NCGR_PEP_ID=MMETSP0463-20121206/3002_1 /TAXON_ID=181622 /ORGANISM="Strombidinopsis sp, Strain SopsisLIS2011" /LENGTH=41 /DNA_ID= /DNA_START= /DNA_END= /DNA_ORIENTATION=
MVDNNNNFIEDGDLEFGPMMNNITKPRGVSMPKKSNKRARN